MEAPSLETADRLGRPVRAGSRVRVLALSEAFLQSLSDEDLAGVREMIGSVYEVDEVDTHGQAWVTKWWRISNRHSVSHSIGLSASEMEVV
jgi:hypothetical protein